MNETIQFLAQPDDWLLIGAALGASVLANTHEFSLAAAQHRRTRED